MPRVQSFRTAALAIAFAVAAFGATALLDRQVDHLGSAIQPTAAHLLQAPPASDGGDIGLEITDGVFESSIGEIAPGSLWLLWIPEFPLLAAAMLIWFGLLCGGLPIAVVAIVLDRVGRVRGTRWADVLESQYYLCFVCQMLSVLFTTALLVRFPPVGIRSYLGVFVAAYFYAQVVVGAVAVPAWRRLLDCASRARMDARILRLAA
jgi:hypothetical protein